MAFQLAQTTDAWQITDATGQPLKDLTGSQLLQDSNEALMNRLWSALRHLDASSLKDGVVQDNEAEEYKIFTLYRQQLTTGQVLLSDAYVDAAIQWDPAFRGAPDPQIYREQLASLAPLLQFLASRQLTLPNLPLNYAESLEELDDDERVPAEIVRPFQNLVGGLTPLRQAGVYFLHRTFNSVVFPILYLSVHCSARECVEGIYASQGFTRSTLDQQEWKSMQQAFPRAIALLERVRLFTCP